jgi:K(+)-stimulated pyrophosphate-energized sodium pump
MVEIAKAIQEGAMAFLKAEYKILAVFIVIVWAILTFALRWETGIAYLGGAFCSIAAGLIGMNAAVRANVRVTQAAKDGGQDKDGRFFDRSLRPCRRRYLHQERGRRGGSGRQG